MSQTLINASSGWCSRNLGWFILGPFALLWCGLTLVGDVAVGLNTFYQLWSYTYVATDGTILKSEVTERDGDDSTIYGVDIQYQYVVAGKVYRGDCYRHDMVESSDNWAASVVAEFPADSRRTVYYSATRPDRSMLRPGIAGADLLGMMFLVPFNAVAIVCVLVAYYTVFPRPAHEASGGVPVLDDGLELRANVPDHSAVFIFGLTLSISCFAMLVIVALSSGSHPPLSTMIAAWGACLGVTIYFSAPRYFRERAGLCDLVIDRFGQRITLPVTHGRQQPQSLSFADVKSIRVKDECKVDSEGDATHLYHVLLRSREGEDQEHCVWQNADQKKAKQFANWLRSTIGTPHD